MSLHENNILVYYTKFQNECPMLLVLPSRIGVSWDSLDREGVALDKEGVVRSFTYPANIFPF
jgi:hypothetical protein